MSNPGRTVAVLVLALVPYVAGCASSQSTEPPAPVEQRGDQQPLPKDGVASAGTADPEIARWTDIVAKNPTADNWNELSYANLQAHQWKAAAKAGQEALNLKHDHPYALYNTAMALLELGKAGQALPLLKRTQALQPTRYEPEATLTRAYRDLGQYLLARYHAGKAVALSKGEPDAARLEQSVAEMLRVESPVNLNSSCAQELTDGVVRLCLYKEPSPQQEVSTPGSAYSADRYTLYVIRDGKPVQRLPLGHTRPGKPEVASLAGGRKGYWIKGGFVGAGVAGTAEWRLFFWEGEELRQVLFMGGDEFEGHISDYMRSPTVPGISGDWIETGHRDDATGSRTILTRWRLSLAEGTARVADSGQIVSGTITQVSPILTVHVPYGYDMSFGLADGAEILLDGKPAIKANLAMGMYVKVTDRPGKVLRIEARSK